MGGNIIGIDHLGVAVKDPKPRIGFWGEILGLPLEKVEDVPTEGVRTWFLNVGGPHIELLEPTSETSPIAKHLEKRGEGIAHLALRVDDMDAMLARLAANGIVPLPPGVRPGAGGAKVAFLHPKDTGGILVELSEHADHDDEEFDFEEYEDEPFGEGTVCIAYLREPREQVYGVIRQLDGVGVALEGIPLDSWDSWVSQWARGEEGPISPSLQYFPMTRVEKLLADSDAPEMPSFATRFEDRTGRSLADAFGLPADEE